jgi:anti-anti-sigma factor
MELATRPSVDGPAVLRVSGEIDLQVADELRDAGLAAVADEAGLAIDLSEVSFIDSSGLAALIAINNALRTPGQRLILLSPSRSVRRILELTGLNPAFTVVD